MKNNNSNRGFIVSLFCLCVILLSGCADYNEARHAKDTGDYETAIVHFEKLAEFGHVPSQVELARLYLRGEGVEKQPERAAELLKSAATQNDKKAHFELGRLYERGQGVSQNDALAVEHYNKAMDLGYSRAGTYLEKLAERNKSKLKEETKNVAY